MLLFFLKFQINGQTALFVAILAQKPEIIDIMLEIPDVKLNTLCNLPHQDGVQFDWSAIHEACRFVCQD